MSSPPARWLSRWLPPATWPGLRQRAAIVWTVALMIALLQWSHSSNQPALSVPLVYSYAISTTIWLLTDPARIALHRWLGAQPPHYWATTPASLLYLFLAIVFGYAFGTLVGDTYAGLSTLDLITRSPQRFWGFWLTSLGISFGFLFYFKQRSKALDLEQQASEARLRLLESQLEPHMLFNTLANLRALIATDPPRAIAMLDRLNDYLRATLSASRTEASSQRHTLALEFDRLRDYLELMAVRMGPRLRYTLVLPPELARHPLPPLLLQPLVENAIRHGLEPHVQGGEIRVEASTGGDHLLLTVSDTGAGCAGEPRAGFGLAQVRERLATAFEMPARLDWHSQPGEGTRINLQLPLAKPTPEAA
jgi:hypothetical protein